MTEERKYNILLIEDDEEDFMITEDLLLDIAHVKFSLDWAKSIAEAKELLSKNTYDLFLCDFRLGTETGFDFLEYSQEHFPKIPVIMLTGQDDFEIDCKALELGASDYLIKGQINPGILGRAIRYATEHKKAQEIIKESEAELRRLNATKDKFFSIIAHDLRSPFTALLSLSEMLITHFESLDDDTKIEYLKMLKSSAENTFKLIENLLQWSRVQRGTIENNPELISVNDTVNSTINLLRQAAKNKKITLLSEVDQYLSAYGDPNMVETIIRNITNNAIKFTKENGFIKIIGEKTDDKCRIIIEDNGIGMDEKTLTSLFEVQASKSKIGTAGETGTGLGLMLCKEFTLLNNGNIYVESDPGEGSRFYIELPLEGINN